MRWLGWLRRKPKTVYCHEHGEQEMTFVCQHLLQSLYTNEPVGFYTAFEPRGHAWCSECEKVRVREGGRTGDWNERSEEVLDVRVLCGRCYDRMRALNDR